jgi:hypothetical protein
MSARLSVIFYIILCFEIGLVLTIVPWWPQGMWGFRDWGNNYFLLYAAQKTGIQGLQAVVASGWVRGAVSGIGLLNLGIAVWEIFHFRETVAALQGQTAPRQRRYHASELTPPNPVRDNERRLDESNNS